MQAPCSRAPQVPQAPAPAALTLGLAIASAAAPAAPREWPTSTRRTPRPGPAALAPLAAASPAPSAPPEAGRHCSPGAKPAPAAESARARQLPRAVTTTAWQGSPSCARARRPLACEPLCGALADTTAVQEPPKDLLEMNRSMAHKGPTWSACARSTHSKRMAARLLPARPGRARGP